MNRGVINMHTEHSEQRLANINTTQGYLLFSHLESRKVLKIGEAVMMSHVVIS